MKIIGERIRRKRETLNMQLGELASRVGISASALSQIEKSKAYPSILTLKSIADNLHTSLGELVGDNDTILKKPLTRFGEMSFIQENQSGCASYLLSKHGAHKQMDTVMVRFNPGADSRGVVNPHPGQAFLFLLEGELEIKLDEKVYQLQQKDSFYFGASQPHLITNTSRGTSLLLMVSTPPGE